MPSSSCSDVCSDRKSTRLNSSHTIISYAVFCLTKKTEQEDAHEDAERAVEDRPPPGVAVVRRREVVRLRLHAQLLLGRFFFLRNRHPPRFTLFPSGALFR